MTSSATKAPDWLSIVLAICKLASTPEHRADGQIIYHVPIERQDEARDLLRQLEESQYLIMRQQSGADADQQTGQGFLKKANTPTKETST